MCLQVVERVRRKAAIYGQDIEGDDTCFVGSNKAMAAIGDCDAQLQPLGCARPPLRQEQEDENKMQVYKGSRPVLHGPALIS